MPHPDELPGEGTERRQFIPSELPARSGEDDAESGGAGADAAVFATDDDGDNEGELLLHVDDEVTSLFAELEGSGQRFGEETRRMVRAKPQTRDVDRVVSVLVRTLVSKREVSEKDLEVVLEVTKSRIADLVRAQVVAISFVEEKSARVRSVSFGRDLTIRSRTAEKRLAELAKKMRDMPLPLDGVAGQVIADGQARTTLDSARAPDAEQKLLEGLLEITIHSTLTVPILHEGATYGLIQAFNKASDSGEQFFSKKDQDAVKEIADYSAKVIYMARNPRHVWSGDDIAKYVARVAKCEFKEVGEADVDRATAVLVGERPLRQTGIVPLKKLSVTKVRVALDDPLDVGRRDAFTSTTGLEIAEFVVTSRDRITGALDKVFAPGGKVAVSVSSTGPIVIGKPLAPMTQAPAASAAGSPLDTSRKTQSVVIPSRAAPASIQTPRPSLLGPKPAPGAPAANIASIGAAFLDDVEKRQKELEKESRKLLEGLGESGDSAPVIQLVNRLLEEAYERGASDIHIDPFETELLVRYRVDGVLEEKLRMPSQVARSMASRIKIMSGLNISELRLPQDGRIRMKEFTKTNHDFDLRVATSPMAHGEKIVLRILDKKATTLGLESMGFGALNLERYRKCMAAPHGMILHTGPTGSGKTTTLYAALGELNRPDMNIMTAEDPVEYMIKGINQLQTKPGIGLTFARALKAYLRQDPDIILVGEIRDLETAEIAIEAALTGHQLFSTLHTNDAAGTVTRFVEMGVEPFLISSALLCVRAQRLVRKLCVECRIPHEPTEEERALCLSGAPASAGEKLRLFAAKIGGCARCSHSGYRGRMGTHELLVMDRDLRELTARKGLSSVELDRAARKAGMISLFDDAMEKVRTGVTSLEEALRTVRVEKD